MVGKFAILAIIFALGIAVRFASASETAPVGKRVYKINTADQFAPAKIEASETETSPIKTLKDPNFGEAPSGKKSIVDELPKADPPRKVVKKILKADHKTKKVIKFSRVDIRGHLREPRVRFTLDRLPVGRSDPVVSADFLDRVYESENTALK